MWFALLIKALDIELVPFQHGDYRDYAATLQQQYQKLRTELDPAIGVKTRIAARDEMNSTLYPSQPRDWFPRTRPRSGPDHKK